MRYLKLVMLVVTVALLSSCSSKVIEQDATDEINDNSIKQILITIEQVEFFVDMDNLSLVSIVVYENEGVMLDEMNEMPDIIFLI